MSPAIQDSAGNCEYSDTIFPDVCQINLVKTLRHRDKNELLVTVLIRLALNHASHIHGLNADLQI